MRSITVIILHALIAQAPAKDMMANIDTEEFADKFIDKLLDRLSGTQLNVHQPLLSRGVMPQPSFRQQSMQYTQPAIPRQSVQAASMPQHEADRSTDTRMLTKGEMELMKDLDVKGMSQALGVAGGLAPLASQAGMTPSLKNLLNSVLAGGVVVGAIFAAVAFVANFDPVNRG